MRVSLLARMRSADGRSLARALAALLFVNALIAGWHAGFLAEAAPGAVVCAYGAEHGVSGPATPHPGDEPLCCLVFCLTGLGRSAAADNPPIPVASAPEASPLAAGPPHRDVPLPASFATTAFDPRGPPVLA